MKKKRFMEIINKNDLYGNSEDPSKTTFYYVLNLLYFFQCDSKKKINIIYYAVFLEILKISGNDKKLFIYSCRTR